MFKRLGRYVGYGCLASSIGLGTWMSIDPGRRRTSEFMLKTTPIAFGYGKEIYIQKMKHKFSKEAEEKKEKELKEMWSKLHEKYAPRVLDIVLNLGGYYIKACQTLVGANILSKEYEEQFKILLSDCPALEFNEVEKIILTELKEINNDIESIYDIFETIERKPLGAASIGQAHKARLKNGPVK